MAILYGKSTFQNVPVGVFGRWVHAVVKEEVEDVCRAALMHEFVRDLLNGYDTLYILTSPKRGYVDSAKVC